MEKIVFNEKLLNNEQENRIYAVRAIFFDNSNLLIEKENNRYFLPGGKVQETNATDLKIILAKDYNIILTEDDISSKKKFLTKHRIALWDVLESCYIEGAKDSSIKDPKPNDINKIILNSKVKKIFTLGRVSYNLYNKYCYPNTNIKAIYLPSTSPLNCALNLEKLTEKYQIIKEW